MTNKKNNIKISKLDYAVMAILHNCELSGYDITNRLKHFWKTSHSRIYPTLAKLEGIGLLKHVEVQQANRPDKKVYTLTEKAIEELRLWILNPEDVTQKAVHDEHLLKLLCCDIISKEDLLNVAKRRMEYTAQAQNNMQKMLENISMDKTDFTSKLLSEVIAISSICDTNIYNWLVENLEAQADMSENLKDYMKRNL